jgi:hypothetical protein
MPASLLVLGKYIGKKAPVLAELGRKRIHQAISLCGSLCYPRQFVRFVG